jgi:hypothetical protein
LLVVVEVQMELLLVLPVLVVKLEAVVQLQIL